MGIIYLFIYFRPTSCLLRAFCDKDMAENDFDSDVNNISEEELYKLGLTYFKENEGRSFHLAYQDKLELVAFTQQANHGSLKEANLPALGTFDIIGKERRAAWESLGNLTKEEAKERFSSALLDKAPGFKDFIIEASKEKEIKVREEEERKAKEAVEEEKSRIREEERIKEETQRRAIQDALNKQTFQQFKCYAEQQYPGNVDQQAILIRQLQEQHYYQYMSQLYQQQQVSTPAAGDNNIELKAAASSPTVETKNCDDDDSNEVHEHETSLTDTKESEVTIEASLNNLSLNGDHPDQDEPEEAQMWTRKEIIEFKDSIRKEESDSIIKIGHGETVTVRVPTHVDGKSLYWEFATDSYDIGFGLFFEWVEPEDTQVTVHISDSEDEDDEEYVTDEENQEGADAESGPRNPLAGDPGPPTSCIIPIYRRDCHEEVYAGSHSYPRQGIYLLKFDNSYSLWRSKNLYYRVYYTR